MPCPSPKGRQVLLQTRIEPDATVSATMEGVISESDARAGDSAVFHEEPGPSDPPVDMIKDDACPIEVMEAFVESWVQALDHEDRKSLAVLLCFVLGIVGRDTWKESFDAVVHPLDVQCSNIGLYTLLTPAEDIHKVIHPK